MSDAINCRCVQCGAVYDWRKSTSRFLRMTYCCFTCERNANGFLIEDFDAVIKIIDAKTVLARAAFGHLLEEAGAR